MLPWFLSIDIIIENQCHYYFITEWCIRQNISSNFYQRWISLVVVNGPSIVSILVLTKIKTNIDFSDYSMSVIFPRMILVSFGGRLTCLYLGYFGVYVLNVKSMTCSGSVVIRVCRMLGCSMLGLCFYFVNRAAASQCLSYEILCDGVSVLRSVICTFGNVHYIW